MVGSLLTFLACTCASPTVPNSPPSGGSTSAQAAPSAKEARSSRGGVLPETCEASTLIPWQGGWLVGDNEDSKKLYAFDRDFSPRAPVALPSEIDDIEAIALGAGGYWVFGSHSTNKDGEVRPKRERLLAPDGSSKPLDLAACPACVASRGLGPDQAGLNIEGAAWWGDKLWLGLRAPLSASGKALLLGVDGAAAVDDTVELDLGGLGIRELTPYGDSLLVIAGPTADANAPHQLYRLDRDRTLTRLQVALPTSTEAIGIDPDNGTLVYVTDGDGKPGKCKKPSTWGRIAFGE